MWNISKYFISN